VGTTSVLREVEIHRSDSHSETRGNLKDDADFPDDDDDDVEAEEVDDEDYDKKEIS
jgi:hypothetical protein